MPAQVWAQSPIIISEPNSSVGNEFVSGQVIVGLKQHDANFDNEVKRNGGQSIGKILPLNALLINVPDNAEDAFIKAIKTNPNVKFASKNHIVTTTAFIPNDPYWVYQWDMRIIKADEVWTTQLGSTDVVVAVVDTGIDYNHDDLSGRVILGPDYANGDNDPKDGNGHGTHVAGTIGAATNDGIGVTGLAQVKLLAVKVLNDKGAGSDWSVAQGITYSADNGADIINLSLGCLLCSLPLTESAVNYAYSKGSLIVAAAGNDGTAAKFNPASFANVVAVSATTKDDTLASYSNFGNWIELSAPGGDTVGGSFLETYVLSTYKRNGYAFSVGTSMASPHVAGVAALVLSQNPSLTNVDLRTHLQNTADDLGSAGFDPLFGNGRVNALTAVTTISEPSPNHPPVANTGGPYSGTEDVTISFDGSGSSDPDGDPLTYSWDFGDGTSGSGVNPLYSYSSGGTFTVSLTVSDGRGGSNSDTTTATITEVNDQPTANAGLDQSVNEGDTVTLDGTASSDPDGTITTYTWTQTAGTLVTLDTTIPAQPTFTASSVGPTGETLTFSLVVTDDGGADSAADTVNINVADINLIPTANAGLDQNGNEGDSFTFDGSGSSDPDGSIVSYDWDFGDGSTGTGITTVHVYADNGIYIVTLIVTDNIGATATDAAIISVSNVAPVANANGPYSGNEGSLVTFSGSVTDPGTKDTHTFAWDFGDSSTGTGKTITHVFSDNGLYTITLTVTDKDGGTGSTTTTADILNVPPTANVGGPYTGTAGFPITFSGSATDPGVDVLTYEWDFEYDGITFTVDVSGADLSSPSHTYSTDGTNTVALRVTDDDGASSTVDAINVTVLDVNQTPTADAGIDQSVNELVLVTLDGSASSDPDGTVDAFAWTQTVGTLVTLTGATTANPTFTAPSVGPAGEVLTFSLVVTDNAGAASLADTVDITVNEVVAAISVTSISPNFVNVGNAVIVTISGSGYVSGASVSLSGGAGPTPKVSNVVVVDDTTITATITTKNGGPPRERYWDVMVTNLDGSNYTLIDGFIVIATK